MSLPTLHELIDALVNGALLGSLFAITALGLALVFGVMRLINLVHGEFVVLGAYLAFELTKHAGLDPLIAMVVIAPVVLIAAQPVQRFLLEPLMDKGPEPALLTTFGLSVILQNVFVLLFSGDTQALTTSYTSSSVNILGLQVPAMYLISGAIALVVGGAVHYLLQRTSLGRDIRASSENPAAADVMGVNVRRVNMFVFGLAAACAAIGGVLVGMTFQFTPTSGTNYLLTGFVIVVLGGLGSVKGTLLGGVFIGIIESLGATVWGDGYRDLVGFVAFLLILSFRPQGLFGRTLPA